MTEIFQDLIYDWIGLSPRRALMALRLRRAFDAAVQQRRKVSAAFGVPVPPIAMISLTTRCNLSCAYCYAANHPPTGDMPPERLERILCEAKKLGCFFFLLSGGEPLLYPDLLETISRHPDALFLAFTNGTPITPSLAGQVALRANLIPLLSLDGGREETDAQRGDGVYDRVREAFTHLKAMDAFYGFSATVTARSLASLERLEFLETRERDGCRLGFYVEYIPVGRSPDVSLCLTPAQRAAFCRRFLELRDQKRMFLVQFPGDEEERGGCVAAGLGLIHINAQGFVEPCPAIHLAADNVAEKSLLECLRSPFMRCMREGAVNQRPTTHACALGGQDEAMAQARLCSRPTDGHPHLERAAL
ncbi:MAG: radical SAM protein [Planctomycetes bacterium]|nr:radical SAM protein [Planctomycetota bacterium]